MITGIILAGGESSRVGQNKMMLVVNDKPLVLHTIDSMRPFVDKVVVVTGKYHEQMKPMLKDVDVVFNKNYQKGMFSSVKEGVSHAEGNFFIIPGDCPFVSKGVINALLKDNFSIRVPVYHRHTGHPIYLHEKMKNLLLKESIESNLRAFRDKVGYEEVDVNDKNILNDIDTVEDYEKLLKERK